MSSTMRRFRIHAIAALIGLAVIVAACTGPAGASSAPVGSQPGGAATSAPSTPASAEPTKAGY